MFSTINKYHKSTAKKQPDTTVKHLLAAFFVLCFLLLSFVSKAQMSGVYSIKPSATGSRNFTSFADAVKSLNKEGVAGSVLFNVAPGQYNEQLVLSEIKGAGASNTITFRAQHPDSVLITYAATYSGKRATINFSGGDYFVFKNMKIKSTGLIRNNVVFSNEANYNVLDSCVFEMEGSSSNYRNIVFASENWDGGSHGNGNIISNAAISGGYYGLQLIGKSSKTSETNSSNQFLNIVFTNVYYFAVHNSYGNGNLFSKCSLATEYSYGFPYYAYNATENKIDSCVIDGGGYGIYNYAGVKNIFSHNKIYNQRNYNVYNYYSNADEYAYNEMTNAGFYNFYHSRGQHLKFYNNSLTGGGKYSYYNFAAYNSLCDSICANDVSIAGTYNFMLYNCNKSLLANNLVYGGFKAQNNNECNVYLYKSDDIRLYHNTLYNQGGGGSYLGNFAYALPSNIYNYSSNRADVRNNILVYDGNFTNGVNIAIYQGTFKYLEYNNYESSKSVCINYSSLYNSLNDWRSAESAYNKNAFAVATYFVDRAKGNLHLSPKHAVPQGDTLGIHVDIDMDKRCQLGQTIGADESKYALGLPKAAFVVDDTVFVNHQTVFLNQNSGRPWLRHFWYLNGSLVYSGDNLQHTFTTLGKQQIMLVTQNCSGSDTFEKTVWVDTAQLAPKADFVVMKKEVELYDQVEVKDLSSHGPDKWRWKIYPDSFYDEVVGQNQPCYYYSKGSSAASENPKLVFVYPGLYSFQLLAQNNAGLDSLFKQHILTVRATSMLCQYDTKTDVPSGTLYDDGGATGNYKNNANCGFLIDPCATEVRLFFRQFDLEQGKDFLRIYDGVDNNGKPLWNMDYYGVDGITGNMATAGFDTIISANSGRMYIELISDSENNAAGFKAEWTSVPGKFAKPTAKFDVADSICLGHLVSYENLSSGDIKSYSWNFGSSNYSVSDKEFPEYVYYYPGKYKVSLVAAGCAGTDTFSKWLTVFKSAKKPVANFSANITRPVLNEEVQFAAKTKNCAEKLQWFFYPSNGVAYLGQTNDSSYLPRVKFTKSGKYDVALVVSNGNGTDTVYKPDFIEIIDYCSPDVSQWVSDLRIDKVELNGLPEMKVDASTNDKEYLNFGQQNTRIERGSSYTLKVNRFAAKNKIHRTAWIDWNQDGTFSKSEIIGDETYSGSYNRRVDFNFTVPKNARKGGTRMRIAVNAGGKPNKACGTNAFGQFLDFQIFVSGDETPPVVALKGPDTVYINQCETYMDSGATVCDNIDGCGLKFSVVGSVNTSKPGAYKLEYVAMDSAGNRAASVERLVVVTPDNVAPTLLLAGGDTLYVEVNTAFKDPGFVATDACTKPKVSIVGHVDTTTIGSYYLHYFAADFSNSSTAQRIVIVQDTTGPHVSLIGADTQYVDVFADYVDSGVVATDNYCDRDAISVTYTSNVISSKPGTYSVNYTAADAFGNKSRPVIRRVMVVDRTAPVVSLIGPDTLMVEVFTQVNDLLAQGIDQLDGDLGLPVKSGSFYQNFPDGQPTDIGIYDAQYVFSDLSGNKDSATRTIIVVDSEVPFIRLKGGSVLSVCRWEAYKDPGLVVDDNYDQKPKVVMDASNLNINSPGDYYITYFAEDQSGNKSAIVTRRVTVEDCPNSIEETAEINQLNAWPNPASEQVHIEFAFAEALSCNLSLYNSQGQLIGVLYQGITKGELLQANVAKLSAGMYVLKLSTAQGLNFLRITVR
ncbi:DUF5011 domain-containing protein [bacterium]|nr:DUF5011 domain-containing protein [bacterium]